MKPRILFVDDEPRILSGVRRALRSYRNNWQLVFASSGREAIKLIADKPCNIVISDMRMPEMDGATLLEWVQEYHPNTIRIILSGFSDEAAIMRTVGVAHQFLAKPINAKRLVDTILEGVELGELMGSSELQALFAGIEHLPAIPDRVNRLIQVLDDAKANTADIAEILAGDIALTAQTLKLTNSAYFGLPQNVDNLKSATSLLGTNLLKTLVMAASFYRMFSGDKSHTPRFERLTRRSIDISRLARAIAEIENLANSDINIAGTAGVLAHVGSLVFQSACPQSFAEVERLIDCENMSIIDAERQVFGAAHPEAGAYLLGLWGFQTKVVRAVACHHEPKDFVGDHIDVLVCVHAAQQLVRTVKEGSNLLAAESEIQATLPQFGDRAGTWIRLAQNVIERSA